MKIAIVTSGYFPVPAVSGGAVESIVENFIKENESATRGQLVVYSCFHEKARQVAETYRNTKVVFIKTPWIVRLMDRVLYGFVKTFRKKAKVASYRYIFQRLHFIRRVGRYLNRDHANRVVFENHATLLSALKYRDNAALYRGKYIYHIHNEITNAFGNEQFLQECPRFIGVSAFVNRQVADYFSLGEDRFRVVKNRVDETLFSRELAPAEKEEMLTRLGIPSGARIILFSGRLTKEKGIDELMRAFRRFERKDLYLLIVGSHYFGSKIKTDFERELNSLAAGKEEHIKFTGFVNYEDMYRYYRLADVVVLPSVWNDPAPLTVIETVMTNRPLITTESGGICEYVDRDCAVVLHRDEKIAEHIYDALVALIDDEDRKAAYREAMKRRAEGMKLSEYYHEFMDCMETL